MAVVYRAKDTMLERSVAIKLLRQDYSNNKAFRDQFHREAKAAANLSHPNIITVHDFGFDAGRLFIVMEYMPGKDLKNLIREKGRFSISEAIHLILQACAGVGYAHRAGIVHCDVKPHNMLVSEDKRLKMTDFGIARALATINPDEKNEEVWGSPQYFSPEQAKGLAPSPASDVYSLGVVLYELLTGQLPFTQTDPQELARMHKEHNPVPPRRFNREIPPALEQIMLKVLAKEPAQRYRSADQLGRVLAPFGTNGGETYLAQAVTNGGPAADQPPHNYAPSAEHTPPHRPAAPGRQASSQSAYTPPPYAQGAGAQSASAQSAYVKPGHIPAAAGQPAERAQPSRFYALMSPSIVLLAILAFFLIIGLIPFWAYIALQFGILP